MNKSVLACVFRTQTSASVVAAGIILSGASLASADIINIQENPAASQNGLGLYTGTIEYNAALFGNQGTLTISLTNTSDPGNGGFLTGFLFNINSADAAATAMLDSATHPFDGVTDEMGNPFGTFDAGAALNGNFLGNGNPSAGIGVGDTGVFEFIVTASDAGSLSANSFISGPAQHNFIARFRGFNDEDSDTVPGMQVPGPGAAALLLLAGLTGIRRRRN